MRPGSGSGRAARPASSGCRLAQGHHVATARAEPVRHIELASERVTGKPPGHRGCSVQHLNAVIGHDRALEPAPAHVAAAYAEVAHLLVLNAKPPGSVEGNSGPAVHAVPTALRHGSRGRGIEARRWGGEIAAWWDGRSSTRDDLRSPQWRINHNGWWTTTLISGGTGAGHDSQTHACELCTQSADRFHDVSLPAGDWRGKVTRSRHDLLQN